MKVTIENCEVKKKPILYDGKTLPVGSASECENYVILKVSEEFVLAFTKSTGEISDLTDPESWNVARKLIPEGTKCIKIQL